MIESSIQRLQIGSSVHTSEPEAEKQKQQPVLINLFEDQASHIFDLFNMLLVIHDDDDLS